MNQIITLRKVEKKDYKFLYDFYLEEKQDPNIRIHKYIAPFDEFNGFFKKDTEYDHRYIIESNGISIGQIRLEKNGGINYDLNKKYGRQGIMTKALEMLVQKHKGYDFYVNINQNNPKSIELAKKFSGKITLNVVNSEQ